MAAVTRRDPWPMLGAVLVVWQGAAWWAGDVALASPWATGVRLGVLAGRGSFWGEAGSTAGAFVLAAVGSVVGGVVLGGVLGLSRVVGRVMEPVLASLYALPKVTLYPVVLLLFGLSVSAKVAFGIMHGLIPVVLLTMGAVQQVRPVYVRTARALRLGPGAAFRHVVLPAVWPEVLGGVRIGVPLALLGVLIGEMFASRRGLGSMAMRAMEVNDTPTLMAVAVLLSLVALGVNAALGWVAALSGRPAPSAS